MLFSEITALIIKPLLFSSKDERGCYSRRVFYDTDDLIFIAGWKDETLCVVIRVYRNGDVLQFHYGLFLVRFLVVFLLSKPGYDFGLALRG
jgi:hypothetical protein